MPNTQIYLDDELNKQIEDEMDETHTSSKVDLIIRILKERYSK